MTGGNGVLAEKTLPLAAAFRARRLEVASAAGELRCPAGERAPRSARSGQETPWPSPRIATYWLLYYGNRMVASSGYAGGPGSIIPGSSAVGQCGCLCQTCRRRPKMK